MNMPDLLMAIRQRWHLVAAVLVATLVLVGIWTALSPRQYVAAATLLFDDDSGGLQQASTPQQPAAAATLLGTQADIIRSQTVALQVMRRMDLASNPAVVARWREQTGGKGSVETWLAGTLQANVSAVPTRNTNVLAVSFRSSDPDFAAAIANGFADAYVATQLRLRTEPAKVYSEWFADRTRDVRQRWEAAQAKLARYQQEHGLIGGEKLDVELGHLNELTAQLAAAEGASADMNSRASRATASPEVQTSPAVVSLRGALAAKTAEAQQLAATLGPNHPDMMAARAAVASLNAKLAEAVSAASGSVLASSQSASQREADLRARLSAQRQHVLRLQGPQNDLAVLQRDVDTAKLAYDTVGQSMNGARLRAMIPQTNVNVLDRAEAPFYPSSPNIPLRLTLAVLLGLGLGLGLAALVEWLSPRVRTGEGVAENTGLATLIELDTHRQARAARAGEMTA